VSPKADSRSIEIGGRDIKVSHADKVLFPQDGITKWDLVQYYAKVGETMLPHVRDRPLSQQRFPDGIRGPGFYHKNIPDFFPDWIGRVKLKTNKGPQQQILANHPAVPAYLANQNCITPHTMLCCAGHLARPDLLIFDLDPATEKEFAVLRQGARILRELLEETGLVPFVKTTGSKGLHITCPIEPKAGFAKVHGFAEAVGRALAARKPDRFTLEFYKEKRKGRVFVDVHRNSPAQTAVPPYAVRARRSAPVATPIEWDELSRVTPDKFTIRNLFRRLSRVGDPWQDFHRHTRPLPDLRAIPD
jgi:bifunctional non-homologous end joining protein LigD